jgi:hypothetical protein
MTVKTTENVARNQFQPKGRVKVVQGSILFPQDGGLRFILNVANMAGKTEGPMYLLFNKKWAQVKPEVRGWFNQKTGAYSLDEKKAAHLLETLVQSDVWVVSCLCQDEKLRTNVDALTKCLKEVAKRAKSEKASLSVSTFLTEEIPELPELLTKLVVDQGINVAFYEEQA